MSSHTAPGFAEFIGTLQSLDFFGLLLPFVILYAVIFLGLKQLDLFENNQRISAIVAVSVAFLGANFFATFPVYQAIITQYVGRLAVTILGLIGLMVVLGISGHGDLLESNYTGGGLALLAIIVFIVAGGTKAILPGGLPSIGIPWSILFWIVLVLIIILWTTGEAGEGIVGG